MLVAQIGYFRTIVNNIGNKNDGVLDIDFRCTDPRLVLERNFPTDTDPTGSQKSKKTLHPVGLTRISGGFRMRLIQTYGSSMTSCSSQYQILRVHHPLRSHSIFLL